MKKLYGIGVGPGDEELITLKAVNLIRDCKYIFVPKSRKESLARSIASKYMDNKLIVELEFPMGEDNKHRYKNAAIKIESILKEEEFGVFLTLGDPMTYSTYIYLMKDLKELEVQVEAVPGITSFSAAAARLGIPLTLRDESFYLADGNIDEEILRRIDCVCILKVTKNKEDIIRKLENNNFRYVYIKRCTQHREEILHEKEEILEDKEYMSLIFARRDL